MSNKFPILGNLSVEARPNVVQVELLTYNEGRPYALFTAAEIPAVIALLTKAQVAAGGAPEKAKVKRTVTKTVTETVTMTDEQALEDLL